MPPGDRLPLGSGSKPPSKPPGKGLPGQSSNLANQMSNLSVQDTAQFPTEIKDALNQLQSFGKTISSIQCSKCKKQLLTREFDLQKTIKNFFDSAKRGKAVIGSLRCKTCSVDHCIGCGGEASACQHFVKVKDMNVGYCCDAGRLAGIFFLLAYYDAGKVAEQKSQLQKQSQKPMKAPSSSGVGYKQENPNDVFNFAIYGDVAYKGGTSIKFKEADKATDKKNEEVMLILKELVPKKPHKQSTSFETKPPSVIGAMFKLSLISELIADLVRNDSITDAATRFDVYNAALDLMMALAQRSVTLPIVTEERYAKKLTGGLLSLSASSQSLQLGPEKEGKNSPIGKIMKSMDTVARTMIDGQKIAPKDFADEEKLIALCNKIKKVGGEVITRVKKLDAKTPAEEWKQFHSKHSLQWIEDEKMLQRHVFRREAESIQGLKKGRMRRLVEEIAELRTSLPEGIFVLAAESRPDVLKVLIQGPEGTPYENGLFEFDVLCPANYPLEPPKVLFQMATRHGKNINPNLHPCGKVCLSLINTWPGEPSEQWQPLKSKLVSVFVSIQSMIFVEHPHENEPGAVEGKRDHANAQATVKEWTAAYAMLAWHADRDLRYGVWENVLREFRRYNANAVSQTVHRWRRTCPNLSNSYDPRYPSFRWPARMDLVQEIDKSLAAYLTG